MSEYDFHAEAVKFASAIGALDIRAPRAPFGKADPRTAAKEALRGMVSTNKFQVPMVKAAGRDVLQNAKSVIHEQVDTHRRALDDYTRAANTPNRKRFFGMYTSKTTELERLRASVAKMPNKTYRDAFRNIENVDAATGAADKYKILRDKFEGIKASPVKGMLTAIATPFNKSESVVESAGRLLDKAMQKKELMAANKPSTLRRYALPAAGVIGGGLLLRKIMQARQQQQQEAGISG